MNVVAPIRDEASAILFCMQRSQASQSNGGHPTVGSITAYPNPITVPDYSGLGVTTLSWRSFGASVVEVHVDAPDGPLFSAMGPVGAAVTGKWVREGTTFYLQDVSNGLPLAHENTLDRVTLHVIPTRYSSRLTGVFDACPPTRTDGRTAGKTLVAGWFSFENSGVTAGDLLARDLACEWLDAAGCVYDIATAGGIHGGLNPDVVNPEEYSQVLFVCGPFSRHAGLELLLKRLGKVRLVGLDITIVEPLESWNPFDILFERDSAATTRAEIVFGSRRQLVPVVGLVLVEPVSDFKDYAKHDVVNETILQFLGSRELSVVEIDTRIGGNLTGLRSAREIESLIARMDVVITTRLHGMVLALKNGVPAIAIDPHNRPCKIQRQAEHIGWPFVFNAETVSQDAIGCAFERCLREEARAEAVCCAERARNMVQEGRAAFIRTMSAR